MKKFIVTSLVLAVLINIMASDRWMYAKSKHHKSSQSKILTKEDRIIQNILKRYKEKTKNRDIYAPPKRKSLKVKETLLYGKTRSSRKKSSKRTRNNKTFKVDKIIDDDNSKILKAYQNWPFIKNKHRSQRGKNRVSNTNYPVTLRVTKSTVSQGEAIKVIVESSHKILKCFGNIGGKKISFLSTQKYYQFRGFLGFDIQHSIGPSKLLIAVLFKDLKVKYLTKELIIKKKVVTPRIAIWVVKRKRVLRRYKRRGRVYKRWRTIKIRVRRYISPPVFPVRNTTKTLDQFQNEVEAKILSGYPKDENYPKGIGGSDDPDSFQYKFDGTVERVNDKDIPKGERAFFNHQYKLNRPLQLWNGPFLQPVYPARGGHISKFGAYRIYRARGRNRSGYHQGLDIAKPLGTPIYAANHGIIVIAKRFGARGNSVVIDHGGGIYSVHYHLSKIVARKGMFVRKGQLIGLVGTTGVSTGPHLHWEIRVHGVSVNPVQWKSLR